MNIFDRIFKTDKYWAETTQQLFRRADVQCEKCENAYDENGRLLCTRVTNRDKNTGLCLEFKEIKND